MIVRFHIEPVPGGRFEYRVSHEGEDLYSDSGLDSIEDCLVAATEGLGQDAVGAEVAYKGIVSGTYALASLALVTAQIAQHALQTTAAIEEVGPRD
jgi:hypothetical protein